MRTLTPLPLPLLHDHLFLLLGGRVVIIHPGYPFWSILCHLDLIVIGALVFVRPPIPRTVNDILAAQFTFLLEGDLDLLHLDVSLV